MKSLWVNIFRGRDREEEALHELLARIPLFERLNRRELQAIARILYPRHYERGEYIFRQGDIGIGMYVVHHGAVEIIYEPTAQLLTELQAGDFFGEVALLNEARRSASARARTETTLLCMLEPDLRTLGARNPRLGFKVLLALARMAGRRLIEISGEYEELRVASERMKTSEGAEPAAGEPVIHELRTGDGAGQHDSPDDRAGIRPFE